MTSEWDDYLAGGSVESYQDGDVAEAWNEHAARSDAALDDADTAIQANDDALYDAAQHLGTDPAAVNESFAQAQSSFEATYEAQLASLGLEPDHEQ